MVQLFDKETGTPLGSITDEQLQFLVDQLEEESLDDTDYYVNEATIEDLQEAGADAALLDVLRKALAGREEMEIRWSQGA